MKMNAGIYYEPRKIAVEEIEKPVPGDNDVVVKNVRAGICGTDLTAYLYDGKAVSIFEGNEFGHEMVGVISEVGKNVTDMKVGDRVFVNPTTCKKDGMIRCDNAGAFSEYINIEEAKWGYNLFKLNDDVSFDEAVVTEPFSVAVHGKNVINVKKGENVVIYGAGTIGLCALCALVNMGVTNAVVIDLNNDRLEMVKELGGTPFNPTTGDTQEFLRNHFGMASHHVGYPVANVDAVIDCAGAPNIVMDYLSSCKKDSRLSVVAVAKDVANIPMAMIMAGEATLRGSCGYTISDIEEVLDSINRHSTKVGNIVTHHFKHKDLKEAFEFASNPANKSIKVVIDYD